MLNGYSYTGRGEKASLLTAAVNAYVLLSLLIATAEVCCAQPGRPGQTRRPVIRGRQHAVASLKPEATQVAERILRAGGNAFDAAVAGQAVLSVVDAELNGIGGDAMVLVYDARSKEVFSINGEGTAPRLATIEWYKENHNSKLPINETLLAGHYARCCRYLVHPPRSLGNNALCRRPSARDRSRREWLPAS